MRLSFKAVLVGLIGLSGLVALPVFSDSIDSHVKSRAELEHGLVLYDYFQGKFFGALVENALALRARNPVSRSEKGEILKGGLMLSYGMADEAKIVFDELLERNTKPEVRNRAWYFLAKFYYNKSDIANSYQALKQIKGGIPNDLYFDYYYLVTLVNARASQEMGDNANTDKLLAASERHPYLLFNVAIGQLKQGELVKGVNNLERVAQYPGQVEELLVLADRAKLGLAQIAMQKGLFEQSWSYLTTIRTTGLYSNRALLHYAWAAIKVKRFSDAIAALQLLNSRSIASSEVQESKVLLAHLYEQEGSPRKALKANLLSIKDFEAGVESVKRARNIINKKEVPEELITNMEAIMDGSDWNSATPSVDYENLTPFLIDLMASIPFNETLKELGDLYYLRRNLNYWLIQAREHLIILNSSTERDFDAKSRELIKSSQNLAARFEDNKSELKLLNLTLREEDQDRIDILIESTALEIDVLQEKVSLFGNLKEAYVVPKSYKPELQALHRKIQVLLQKTELSVIKLEPVMRKMVKAELDKHEERMSYYSAQSRLAKARLYDTTLSTLRDAQRSAQEENPDGKNK